MAEQELDDFGEPIPDFGPPIFRVTDKAIAVKLSRDAWTTTERHGDIILYLNEDGKIVQAVIVLEEEDDVDDE